MSRNLKFSSCGFFLGLMACASLITNTLITSTLAAQEASDKHPAPAPAIPGVQALIPGVQAVGGHPFLALLDDVTIKTQPYADGYFSFTAQCQLNAPIDTAAVANAVSTQSETEADWAELLTYTLSLIHI